MYLVASYTAAVVALFNGDQVEKKLRSLVHSEAEMKFFAPFGTYRGPDGWAAALTDWRSSFADPFFEIERAMNPPGPHVLIEYRYRGRGAGSGLELGEDLFFAIFEFRKGMVVHGEFVREREPAMQLLEGSSSGGA